MCPTFFDVLTLEHDAGEDVMVGFTTSLARRVLRLLLYPAACFRRLRLRSWFGQNAETLRGCALFLRGCQLLLTIEESAANVGNPRLLLYELGEHFEVHRMISLVLGSLNDPTPSPKQNRWQLSGYALQVRSGI